MPASPDAVPPGPTAGSPADAVRGNWVDRLAPPGLRPYLRLMRLDRPVGSWLLMWPCWWSSVLASLSLGERLPNLWHLALFLVGAWAMRGAGCVYNDLIDRDYDARVERTRSRPLAAGAVTPETAKLLMAGLAAIGLLVLLQLNAISVVLGFASLAIVALYPFMKRFTHWPQAVLGLAFGWGALVGWAAGVGSLGLPALVLYAASIAWIIGYDTIYAHQDKEDDALIGLKSTALRFGESTPRWLVLFYGLAWLGFFAATWMAGGRLIAATGLGLLAMHMAWQIATLDIADPANCLVRFRSNHLAGAIFFVALTLDLIVQGAMRG